LRCERWPLILLFGCNLAGVGPLACGRGVSLDPSEFSERRAIGGSGGQSNNNAGDTHSGGGAAPARGNSSGDSAAGGGSASSSWPFGGMTGEAAESFAGASIGGGQATSGGRPSFTAGAAGDANDEPGVNNAASASGAGGSTSDAAGGSGGDPGTPAALRCDPSQPFQDPVPVPGLVSGAARARFSQDEKTVYFALRLTDHWYLAQDTRSDRTAAFGVTNISLLLFDSTSNLSPTLSGDGRTLYFESSWASAWHISVARRRSASASFASFAAIAETYSPSGAGGPYLLPDESSLYFHRADQNGDLFRIDRATTGFDAPVALDSVNSAALEAFPVVSPDGLVLYFVSVRGDTGYDIWMASRSSRDVDFGSVQELRSLNTPQYDIPTWISPDGCRLYFERGTINWLDNQTFVAERVR